MISSFEVGAVFRIVNEASPALSRILRQVRELTAAVDKARASMAEITKGLGGVGLSAAIGETRALATEWKSVADSAGRARAAMAGAGSFRPPAAASGGGGGNRGIMRPGARGGGGGYGNNFHVSSIGTQIPGGHMNFRGGGNAGLIAGGLVADSIYQASELEKEAFLAWWHAGMTDTPGARKTIRDMIQKASADSGYNFKEVGQASEDIFRLMRGTPNNGLDIAPELLRAGATESLIKGTSLKESVKTLIELAHMQGIYDPEELKKNAAMIGFMSTLNPATLPQFGRSASYSVPTVSNAMGIRAADVMFENIAIARAGATGSKSGTWVEHAFDRALPPDPHTMSDKAYARRMWAMRKGGLVDSEGKSTIIGDDGRIDIDKFLSRTRGSLDLLPLAMRNSVTKAIFGEQGARGFELMTTPTVLDQTRKLKAEAPDFRPKYDAFLGKYNEESTIQKARTTYAEFNNLLSDIGDKILPGVNRALSDFSTILRGLQGMLPNGQAGATVAARAIEGSLAGAAVGTFAPGVGTLAGAVTGGALGTAEGFMELYGGRGAWPKSSDGGSINPRVTAAQMPKTEVKMQTNINLDGRSLASALSEIMVDMFKFSTEAPAADGLGIYNGGGE